MNGITPGKKNKLDLSKAETPKTPKDAKTGKQEAKTPKQDVKTPKQDKKTPKQEGKTPKQDKKTPKTPTTPGQKKVLEGGIVAEDLKPGEGPIAKPGKMVTNFSIEF